MKRYLAVLFIFFFALSAITADSISAPSANQKVCKGKPIFIKWSPNYFAADNVKISLYKGNFKLAKVLVNSVANNGRWMWQVPANLQTAKNYRINIKSLGRTPEQQKFTGFFKIVYCGKLLAREKGRPHTDPNITNIDANTMDTSKLTSVDICDNFNNLEHKVYLTKFTMTAADPYNRNSRAIGDLTLHNRGNRCVPAVTWRLYNSEGKFIAVGKLEPEDYGKTKWLLRGGEKFNARISVPGVHIWGYTPSEQLNCFDPFKICNRVELKIQIDVSGYHTNAMETIVKWAFDLE